MHLDRFKFWLPREVSVPWPRGAGQQAMLDAGDRQVQSLAVMRHPNIVALGQLLDDAECEALINGARASMSRSSTLSAINKKEVIHASRTSDGMFYQRGSNPWVTKVEERLSYLLDWPIENGEGMQILRYGPGAEYKPHYDYFSPLSLGTPQILKRGGQRVATVVMYLNTPEAGGSTVFPQSKFDSMPVKGNAVFFNYSRAHPVSRSLHGGSPVLAGEKWVAVKWYRERAFN